MKTWYKIQAKSEKPRSADISIHDEIGLWGISASQFMRDLRGMGELDEINLSIHSPGGDVLEEGEVHDPDLPGRSYLLPFDACDRETDMRQAHDVFVARQSNRGAA